MKTFKTKRRIFLPLLGGIIALSSVLLINSNVEKVDAYPASSLPTTINLNDCDDATIKSYYSSLTSKSTSEKQGTNLLKNLKEILKNGQKYYNYDSAKANIWKMYEIIDRDWVKSPATSISGYNSSTNTINGYSYNSTDPYVHSLYTKRSVDNQAKAWENHQQDGWGINQEHIWAKSQGFEATGAGGARGDVMHLQAANGKVNNLHSNYMYGYVDLSKSYSKPSENYLDENYLGVSLTTGEAGNEHKVFEPQDSDKGDIARSIFYMVARYNFLSGSDSDGIDSNNPNLELRQSTEWLSSYTSTTTTPGYQGLLTDLLNWNHIDPPDEREIHRNNLLYRNYTNNRNPFIDYPEWADYIWGSAVYNGRQYQSYSSNPTGSVDLSTDVINGFKGSTKGITISTTSLSVEVSETAQISATSTSGSDITWTTSDSNIASISSATSASGANITITGVSKGDATITASTTIDSVVYSKTCDVTVKESSTTRKATRVTNASGLTTGDEYIIVASDSNYALSTSQGTNSRGQAAITKADSNATVSFTSNTQVFKLEAGTVANSYSFYDEGNNGYIYAASSTSNYLRTEATKTANSSWSISFSDNNAEIVAQGTNTRNRLKYNSSSKIFSCYATDQQDVSIYKVNPVPVAVTGVSLNKTSLEIANGCSETLIATVEPNNATDKTVTWSSSSPFVASVDSNGVVSAIAEGTTDITVTTNDGEFTDTCSVTVIEDEIASIEIDESSSKLSYYVDEQFLVNDISIICNYVHASPKVLDSTSSELTFLLDDTSANKYTFKSTDTSGKTLTVQYNHDSLAFIDTASVSVSAVSGALYKLSGADTHKDTNVPTGSSASYLSSSGSVQLSSGKYMTLSLSGYKWCEITGISLLMRSNSSSGAGYISVKANEETIASIGSSTNPISFEDESFNGRYCDSYRYVNLDLASTYSVHNETIVIRIDSTENSLFCSGVNVRYNAPEPPTLESISLSGTYQTNFIVGETFTHSGMIVTAHYDDESSEDVTTFSSWSTPDMSTAGEKTITVTYLDKETTYNITVTVASCYSKVTSEPTSWAGTYLLAYDVPAEDPATEVTNATVWTGIDSSTGGATSCSVSSGKIYNIPSEAVEIVIAAYNSGYSIKVKGGTNNGKYISGTSGSNKVNFSTSASEIAISYADNSVSMISNTSVMRFNNTNSMFRFYKSASYTGQKTIQLYKYNSSETALEIAESYATKLSSSIECYGGSQTPTISSSTSWAALSSEFAALSDGAKAYLINATFTVSGTSVTPSGETTQKIAEGMAKYDQLVSKYPSTYNNFMGRDISGYPSSIFKSVSDSPIIIIAVTMTISFIIVGGYFFYERRRKHN